MPKMKEEMRVTRPLLVAVLAFVMFAALAVMLADGRVALVGANSTYVHIRRLPDPTNAATAMSVALCRLGCEVTTGFDADRVASTEALHAFARRAHRIEMDGVSLTSCRWMRLRSETWAYASR